MLEAQSHKYIKIISKNLSFSFPHDLTLTRLVARSLRRKDNALISFCPEENDFWWLAILIPICLQPNDVVLVLSKTQRHYILEKLIPLLNEEGLYLLFCDVNTPLIDEKLWIFDYSQFTSYYLGNDLQNKRLIFPEAACLSERLGDELMIRIKPEDWFILAKSYPIYSELILNFYQKFGKKLFINSTLKSSEIRIDFSEMIELIDLLVKLENLPNPWRYFLNIKKDIWATWATLDYKNLNLNLYLRPIEPFNYFRNTFNKNSCIFLNNASHENKLLDELHRVNLSLDIKVTLSNPINKKPFYLYIPSFQPSPNSEIFSNHLLTQSRRLIIGVSGLSILLVDDSYLRNRLSTELAAEFGKRVDNENASPKVNGVIFCRYLWWLKHKDKLPIPSQLIIAILPFPSLSSPVVSESVRQYKKRGEDWFRDFLLPEVLNTLPSIVRPLRINSGRLAILDGRLRSRSWGYKVFKVLEPWIPIQRLLPE
tara:strand:- start:456 stop:1901 length:1446 start_codon:yes stop_codon:yes gene_type:complete